MTTAEKIIKKRVLISCVEDTLDSIEWGLKSTINELETLNATIEENFGEITDIEIDKKLRLETKLDFYNKLTKYLDDFI